MFYVELDVFSKFPELFLLFMFLFHNRGLCSIFDIKIGCKILFISITLQVMQISVGCGDQSNVVLRIFHHNETIHHNQTKMYNLYKITAARGSISMVPA